ncbi:enzymatic polyprotein [Labeo rohita]|uniref:ribonuclease H n=1 Tax=Labeo rohita TaxID=84645 RepID=A0ABQ8L5N6_LABRO|nr:enzymatic polyprotein [Labeo rohita]
MAVRFGGNGFYIYHVFFATQAAGRLQQFNQGTYWGTLDTELYCRIFAARTSLSCELCGAPSHPASMCTVVKPQPSSSRQTSVFNRLSSAAPPPSIVPKPLDIRPTTPTRLLLLRRRPRQELLPPQPNCFASMTTKSALSEPNTRISPVGIATRKYSGKKRLIIDLSSPHGSHIPSINSIIPAPDFSMKYASIDQAISLIRKAGLGAWLSKADITSAFKVMPIHPEFWRFFGIFWKGAYYFAVRLTFGCKSSPKIFDSLSEALCWILINNHKLPYVLHLLDDFLIITPPSTPSSLGLSTLVQVFNELGVPLSKEKTLGPCTSIEFLGITLDSISFQVSLPSEKVQRISLLLSNYLLVDRCTKQQLLALLGHLNYAIRIIPQGKSFLSHLLSKVTTIPSLHDKVTLDEGYIQLYTDAAPSTGFGGYYSGRWFASEWPPEFSHLAQQSDSPSSTLFEIYPVIIAAILWGHEWSKHIILIHSDNSAVVDIINKGRAQVQDLGSRLRHTSHASSTIFCYHLQLNPRLEDLSHASREAILDGLAPSTLSAYLTGWNCFKAYHSYYQIQTYLSGINFILKLATGEQCHPISHSHVTMLIKGLRKREPASSARRLPLTSDLLSQCICTLRSGFMSPSIDRTLECMFLLAFFGFLRCSELAPSTSAFNPAIHPSLSDISAHTPDSLIYTLKKSKTDQFEKSCPIYIFRLNSFISPFEPISEYVLSRYANNSSPQEPLFLTENGKMATRFWFNKHFLKVVSASGISPEHYSLHSFRIGAATTAASADISDETIRVMGCWSSEAYRLYIRNNLNDLLQAQAHISSFKPLGVF